MLFLLYTILAAATIFRGTVAEVLDHSLVPSKRDDSQNRVLTAINLRSELEKREVRFKPKHTWDHHYADHVSLIRGESARFAKTSMSFNLPALTLEDIEGHLNNIECLDSIIVLEFGDELVLRQARREWDGLSKFIVISSHPGCNGDGQRAAYLVSDVTYSANGETAVFSVHRLEWKKAYNSMKVDFGMTDGSLSSQYSISGLRLHDSLPARLGRRQAAASSSIVYPPAPTTTPSSDSSIKGIGFSFTNQPLISSETQNSLAAKFTVGCKNCSLVGTLEITKGMFIVNNSVTNDFEEAFQFIEHGFFNVVANGVNARMELDTSISISQTFTKTIYSLTLPGFQIPGIAVVGPQFNVALNGGVEITKALDFTYGFDLAVPEGSSITFNIGNLSDSSSQGFSDSIITAIPFAASSDNLSLTLSVGLRAGLLLGVDVLSGSGNIHAGIFLDLPSLSVSISSVSSVNAHCEPLTSSTTLNGVLSHVFPNLTHIAPMVNVGVSLEAGAVLKGPALIASGVAGLSTAASTALTETSWALETACLSWDSKATAFVEPSFSTTSTTAAAAATETGLGTSRTKENSGARLHDENPFVQKKGMLWVMTTVLGGVILVFAAL